MAQSSTKNRTRSNWTITTPANLDTMITDHHAAATNKRNICTDIPKSDQPFIERMQRDDGSNDLDPSWRPRGDDGLGREPDTPS
jgi:hypothetical protein